MTKITKKSLKNKTIAELANVYREKVGAQYGSKKAEYATTLAFYSGAASAVTALMQMENASMENLRRAGLTGVLTGELSEIVAARNDFKLRMLVDWHTPKDDDTWTPT